jgi:hypothetical protein
MLSLDNGSDKRSSLDWSNKYEPSSSVLGSAVAAKVENMLANV